MNAIIGHCFTNLDDYKLEEWPTQFQYPPRVGECIAAKSRKSLRVVAVTHEFGGTLRIELHR